MDVVKAVETYITKLVSVPSAMKVLLLDTHTVSTRLPGCRDQVNNLHADTDRVIGLNAVDVTFTSSLFDRSNRQHQTGEDGTYEMCMLSPAQRR